MCNYNCSKYNIKRIPTIFLMSVVIIFFLNRKICKFCKIHLRVNNRHNVLYFDKHTCYIIVNLHVVILHKMILL